MPPLPDQDTEEAERQLELFRSEAAAILAEANAAGDLAAPLAVAAAEAEALAYTQLGMALAEALAHTQLGMALHDAKALPGVARTLSYPALVGLPWCQLL